MFINFIMHINNLKFILQKLEYLYEQNTILTINFRNKSATINKNNFETMQTFHNKTIDISHCNNNLLKFS